MPRAGLTTDRVVLAAAELADELADQQGAGRLTLAALAERLGVKQPSLYKHVDSLDGLQRGMSVLAKRELGQALSRACVGRSGPDALAALAVAYRDWVRAHPGRYAATVRAPAPDDAEDQQASAEVLAVVVAVLDGLGLRGDDAVDAARTVRSAIHGFVALEAAGGFGMPRELGASFDFLVATLVAGLEHRGS